MSSPQLLPDALPGIWAPFPEKEGSEIPGMKRSEILENRGQKFCERGIRNPGKEGSEVLEKWESEIPGKERPEIPENGIRNLGQQCQKFWEKEVRNPGNSRNSQGKRCLNQSQNPSPGIHFCSFP